MQATLQVTRGPHAGRHFDFHGHDTFLVGRSRRAHLQLAAKDLYFSRMHFLIEINPPQCRLMDLGSRNGTHVNGKRVDTIDLKHGDQIKAGHTVFMLTLGETQVHLRRLPTPLPAPPPREDSTPHRPLLEMPDTVVVPRVVPCCMCGDIVAGKQDGWRGKLCSPCQRRVARLTQTVPGHRLFKELGRGDLGVVYLAAREKDGRLLAVKTILPASEPRPGDIDKFLVTAHQLRYLDHPHIVPYRDFNSVGGSLWASSEYVPGVDAGRLVRKHGPLSVGRATALISQVLQALEYAHPRGFVHRDLKPSNLLVTRHADKENVRLTDFGLRRVYQASPLSGLTMTTASTALLYMAPERLTHCRESLPASDQYAAAMTLYYLLTGCPGLNVAEQFHRRLQSILEEEPVPLRQHRPDVPEELAQAIHRALCKEPAGRFSDVGAFRQALAPFQKG